MKTKIMLFLLLTGLTGSLAMAQTKIGYANLELVLAYLPETQQMSQQLETFQKQLAKKLESKRNYFDTKYQEYVEKSQTPGVTEEEMMPLQAELQKLQEEIQRDAQKADNDLMQKQSQMMGPVLEKLESEIKKLAQEKGYTYILNSSASGTSILVHAPEADEISRDLLKRMGVNLEEEGN